MFLFEDAKKRPRRVHDLANVEGQIASYLILHPGLRSNANELRFPKPRRELENRDAQKAGDAPEGVDRKQTSELVPWKDRKHVMLSFLSDKLLRSSSCERSVMTYDGVFPCPPPTCFGV